MTLQLGDLAPNFEQDSTAGTLNFHEYLGDSWGVFILTPQRLYARVHHRAGHHGKVEAGV